MQVSRFIFVTARHQQLCGPRRQVLTYSRLILTMKKRRPGKFSVTKAVKANARERVGQPKPSRVLESELRTGRDVKHKPKLEEMIRQEE